MNNPTTDGYDLTEAILYFEKQVERTKRRAKVAVSRNATSEEISALGAKMRHYKTAIAALRAWGGKYEQA